MRGQKYAFSTMNGPIPVTSNWPIAWWVLAYECQDDP